MIPFFQENAVKLAVKKIGGVTKASNLLGVSNGAVHSWVKRGMVTNIDFAKKIAELSGVPLDRVRPC